MRRFFCLSGMLLTVAVWLLVMSAGSETACETLSITENTPKGKWILIELDRKRLTLYDAKTELKSYPIASGAWDTPSPIGSFKITNRFSTELSGFGTRFLGLNVPWGQYGIHGTNKPGSIGNNASHGCIRMRVSDAEELYALVPYGTKVVIEGGPYGPLGDSLRTLSSGDRSSHVQAVQQKLKLLEFYQGTCDGVYGQGTSAAVRRARKAFGLSDQDVVDAALYKALGLMLFE